MKTKLQSRKDKIQLLGDLQCGQLSLQQFEKKATGKIIVLTTFLDHLKFYNCVDEHGNKIDRQAEVEAGIIEVEISDSPFNNFLKGL
jgi:hypothetical protein